jgi:hypothetical protein
MGYSLFYKVLYLICKWIKRQARGHVQAEEAPGGIGPGRDVSSRVCQHTATYQCGLPPCLIGKKELVPAEAVRLDAY